MGKRVALVLGSGGARGYAHIGVIEELEARGYQIGCIAGCSMGAVIGGIHAAGKLPEYRQWIESLDYLGLLRLLDVSFSLGVIRGDKIFARIREIVGEVNIEDLPIPFTAVATDLTTYQEVWFQEGCLHQAMRASAAIPSLFTPVTKGHHMLVDGGLLNPLPIVPVVSSHCDLIVAVNLGAANHKHYRLPVNERQAALKGRVDAMLDSLGSRLPFRRREGYGASLPVPELRGELGEPPGLDTESPPKSASGARVVDSIGPATLLDLVNQSFEVMQSALTQYKIAGYPPDILINVPKQVCRFFEFHKAPEMIQLGREIARDSLDAFERDA
ncbi:NTE family protein [Azotobacter beijerinckii]|uniref:NTE family protein n=1 Tax=Azotobacter beijerinckii TaxID=170623 RepID=A0A1H9G569_9GAMM|nr:patatin-like phospholipase family protein [Azotobacter beijerinckii]SEI52674.1 NTE family protein [Azotobacter beijerinckii]SEJ19980.1 NTE family protein [Azotobacter beijerinckii]SEQ45305.1 NTE family protein [Azotobacter beijerinckii]